MYHTEKEINKLAEEKFNQLTKSQKEEYLAKNRDNMKKLIITYIFLACLGFFSSLFVLGQIEYFAILNLCFSIPLLIGVFIIYIANFKNVNEKRIIISLLKQEIHKKDAEYNREHGITVEQLYSEIKLKKENETLLKRSLLDDKTASFVATKKIDLPNNSALLINDENREMIFKVRNIYGNVYSYDDLINYEVYENDNSVVKGTIGKSIVGGTFFGLAGMIVGANSSRKIQGKCNNLRLIIRLNDADSSSLSFDYITIETDKNSAQYTTCIQNLQKVVSILEYIMNKTKLEEIQYKNRTLRDELEDLKALLDEGIITQEEFDKKKQKLLNE